MLSAPCQHPAAESHKYASGNQSERLAECLLAKELLDASENGEDYHIGVVAFSGEMPTGHQQPLGFLGTWIADVTAPIARATAGMPIIIQGILLIALAALVITAAIIIPQRKHDTGDEDAAIASILEHEHDHDTHGAGADEQQES